MTEPSIDNDLRDGLNKILADGTEEIIHLAARGSDEAGQKKAEEIVNQILALFTQYKSQVEREARIDEFMKFSERYSNALAFHKENAHQVFVKSNSDRLQALSSKGNKKQPIDTGSHGWCLDPTHITNCTFDCPAPISKDIPNE